MKKWKKLKLKVESEKLKLKNFFCFWFNIDLDSEFPVLHFWLSKNNLIINLKKNIAFDSILI